MLVDLPLGWTLNSFDTVTTTMDEARLHLQDKQVILARSQTQGRGRQGRKWISDPGNLFCSLIIRPHKPQQNWPELTFVTTMAVGETIDCFLPNCDFLTYKWPNDILLKGKKVSGILLEVCEDFMIIGIGINLKSCPEEGNYPPTCLANFQKIVPTPQEMLSTLVSKFQNLEDVWQTQGFAYIRETWLRRAALKDQKINLKSSHRTHNGNIQGLFQGIDYQGNLLLKLSNGEVKSYSTGDVSMALKEDLN